MDESRELIDKSLKDIRRKFLDLYPSRTAYSINGSSHPEIFFEWLGQKVVQSAIDKNSVQFETNIFREKSVSAASYK